MDMMSKVYVVQEPLRKDRETGLVVPKIDLAYAEPFGEIVIVLDWSDTRKLSATELVWKVRHILADYKPEDYVLMVGSPTAMWLVGAIAAEKADGYVKTLEWDNVHRRYNVFTVNLEAQPV
jgi:hypothetical protein